MNAAEYRSTREGLGLSRPALSRLLGVSSLTLLRRETGRAPITEEAARALAAIAAELARRHKPKAQA